MNEQRRPAAFRLDDPDVVVTLDRDRAHDHGAVRVALEGDPSLPAVPEPAPPRRRRFPWGKLFWLATGGLVALGIGLAVTQLIEDLFSRNAELGVLGAGLAGIASLALLVIASREAAALWRLA